LSVNTATPATRRTVARVLVPALGLALLLSACSSSGSEPSAAAPQPSVSTTPPPVPRSFLSGRPDGDNGQVLAAKVDNTVNSHPQAGLRAADIVYVEEVEYGLTRFMAVYSSKYPKEIGPIRSARISDIALLRQYGTPAFAFSGARPGMQRLVARARVYDVSGDVSGKGYWREPGRVAPWDFWGRPRTLLKRAPKASHAQDIGFTWDTEKPSAGTPVKRVTVTWPYSKESFRWDAGAGRWLLTTDGQRAMAAEGGQLGGTTVIVQSVPERNSRFHSENGGVTPLITTTGTGKAWVFRDGRMWRVDWSRPTGDDGTTWTYRGQPFPMAPGQVWILLLAKGDKPQINR
jgi:hypothetical protein